jgi:hypothetical protein
MTLGISAPTPELAVMAAFAAVERGAASVIALLGRLMERSGGTTSNRAAASSEPASASTIVTATSRSCHVLSAFVLSTRALAWNDEVLSQESRVHPRARGARLQASRQW